MVLMRILLLLVVFVNISSAMETSPEWEKIRKEALYNVEHDRSLLPSEISRRIHTAKNIHDILFIIAKQAKLAIHLPKSLGERSTLRIVVDKAQPGITNRNMNYCLRTLEQFFTGKTDKYQIFNRKKTITAAKELLENNMQHVLLQGTVEC